MINVKTIDYNIAYPAVIKRITKYNTARQYKNRYLAFHNCAPSA